MKKVLEVQDIHVCPSWIEQSKKHIDKICEVAHKEKVDAILVAGDFFHKMVMASDKGNWRDILDFARQMQDSAQVYYVHGTLSHDAPGCYESFKDIGWIEVGIGQTSIIGDELMIMGIPEITPAVLAANFPELNKMELISKQYDLVNDIIDDYYTPLASKFFGSVHFMGHGHIAGTKFRDDQKPRSSDFMYSEEMLKRIGADRYQFGHIHLPQKYYGGSAHITWGDLNFKPGFNVTTYDSDKLSTERFDYGELERQKLVIKDFSEYADILSQIKTDVNLWLDIECDKEFADQFDYKQQLEDLSIYNIGPLSKITCNIQHIEHTRIDSEEYEAAKTIEDLYKIYDPEASKSILQKVKEAEQETGTETCHIEKHDFEFVELYLKGTKAGRENGVDEIRLTTQDFITGANLLVGPNGIGKSFTLGFMTPFSCHLPKEDDFKSMFELKDSQIVRKFLDGDKIITQKILIDPTLANPTAKYYMDIDGESLTPDGNKAPFDESVEKIFGSIKMFMTCVFRGQKENSKYPSLENAKESDIRKIYTELSGIDRSSMKQHAHDKAVTLKRDIELDSREKVTLETTAEDKSMLNSMIKSKNKELDHSIANLEAAKIKEKGQKGIVDKIQLDVNKNIEINNMISVNDDSIKDSNKSILSLDISINDLKGILKDSQSYKTDLSALQKKQNKYNEVFQKSLVSQSLYNKIVENWFTGKEKIDDDLAIIASKAELIKSQLSKSETEMKDSDSGIKSREQTIKDFNKPCEHCGKLSTAIQEKINIISSEKAAMEEDLPEIAEKVLELSNQLLQMRLDYKKLQDKKTPKPKAPAEIKELSDEAENLIVSPEKLKFAEQAVKKLETAEAELKEKQKELIQYSEKIKDLTVKNEKLNKDLITIDNKHFEACKQDYYITTDWINQMNSEIGQYSAELSGLVKRLENTKDILTKIETIDSRLSSAQTNKTEWEKIESAFSPKGIPAMELSLLSPIIDREANALLDTYGSRFKVQTITQEFRGKNLIEKFKILIHDDQASEVKNLPVVSGGQGVWITKALQESISKIASIRTGRNWMYSIMDEADAALDSEIIPIFYQMMDKAMDGNRKLISVSHSSEAKSSISSIINMTDFFIKGEN